MGSETGERVTPEDARDALGSVEDVEERTSWRPSLVVLAASAASYGLVIATLILGNAWQALAAVGVLIAVTALLYRRLTRPGVRTPRLAGPDTSWRTVLLTCSPMVWVPVVGLARHRPVTTAEIAIAVGLGVAAAAHYLLVVRHEARRA